MAAIGCARSTFHDLPNLRQRRTFQQFKDQVHVRQSSVQGSLQMVDAGVKCFPYSPRGFKPMAGQYRYG